jgi:hypothetical protein
VGKADVIFGSADSSVYGRRGALHSGRLGIRRRNVVFSHLHLKTEADQSGPATMKFCAAHEPVRVVGPSVNLPFRFL